MGETSNNSGPVRARVVPSQRSGDTCENDGERERCLSGRSARGNVAVVRQSGSGDEETLRRQRRRRPQICLLWGQQQEKTKTRALSAP